ncbi:DUF5397 family protein [Phreatobacter sp.]|uniref:DUF5397 family protein n=1 Tax=Phreatobacter sp. TaxID=1966341 RepID=UPI00261397C9|nr:DUF5397 family protein [Phreatobacter sp.]
MRSPDDVRIDPAALVGSCRRFGLYGPVYEILAVGTVSASEGLLMQVRVVTTGETVDYPLTDILDDPLER